LPHFVGGRLEIDQILRNPPSGDTSAFFSVQQTCAFQFTKNAFRFTFGARTEKRLWNPAVLQLAAAPDERDMQQADGVERHVEHARIVVKTVVVSDPRHRR
jgi:hypothetical protein